MAEHLVKLYLPECELTNDLKTLYLNQLLDIISNVGECCLSVMVLIMTLFRITHVVKTFMVGSASVSKQSDEGIT